MRDATAAVRSDGRCALMVFALLAGVAFVAAQMGDDETAPHLTLGGAGLIVILFAGGIVVMSILQWAWRKWFKRDRVSPYRETPGQRIAIDHAEPRVSYHDFYGTGPEQWPPESV
jgi:hypothetical protein